VYGVEYHVDQLQHEILNILAEVDAICKKNNIEYSLHGGTLLGAVREHGFIPWDDDGDISMTRENFNQFARVFNKQCRNYHMVCDEGWVFRIVKRAHTDDGEKICVDVFIYDDISSNLLAQQAKIFLLRMLQGMLKEHIVWKKYKGVGRVLTFGTYVLGRPFSRKTKLVWYRWASIHAFAGDRKCIQRTDDRYNINGINIILPKEAMSGVHYVPFENTMLPISDDYDTILTTSYGADYMHPNHDWSYD
jgi:lipopolysaccharide cholinephosphotransferase